jgi:hypothetical protein
MAYQQGSLPPLRYSRKLVLGAICPVTRLIRNQARAIL